MNGNDPYDPSSGRGRAERDYDPLTDPWWGASALAGEDASVPPQDPSPGADDVSQRAFRSEDPMPPAQGGRVGESAGSGEGAEQRPRGRRRRSEPPQAEGPAAGGPARSEDVARERPRGRRRRTEPDQSADTSGRQGTGSLPADGTPDTDGSFPGEADGEGPAGLEEVSFSRRLDFDAVPVRRKRSRPADDAPDVPGEDADPVDTEAPRRRRRRRGTAGGAESAVPAGEDREEEHDQEERSSRQRSTAGRRRSERGRGGRGRSTRRAAEPRKRRRPRLRWLAVGAVLVVLLAGGGYVLVRDHVFPSDYEGKGTGSVEVTIPEGASGAEIGRLLAEQNVVASANAFTGALSDSDAEALRPGAYEMRKQMSAEAAIALLLDPESRMGAQVTLQEGWRASRILDELADSTALSRDELQEAYEDPQSLGLPDYAERGPEGYLFPETYAVSPNDDATDVLSTMVEQYRSVAEETELEELADERGLSPNELMSVAAVVQTEAGSTEDMPKIARVIYNRLDEDMELGMDSTCFYVIEEYGIALNDEQRTACTEADSDYATYGRTGLPAGPINSPGKEAILASLNPAEGDWLYFVATDPENGVTEFAETRSEFRDLKAEFEANREDQ
ncbi:UPF0755 protein [Haloactinospora alba]|uniref:Endolytic murein transglycosylase n=1 Tax=Haloactinospora alba TaxID=405555 RepID=A0A543NHE1_9ACTN|nr:endolytic transglycosylase MltG [Haloactinospora alba]TQN31268.1 UPF0755 protein [Haloactinospora alba]